jgi:hypothetical protein
VQLPDGSQADLETKLGESVLNPFHREGKHKAHVFEALLGITLGNRDTLRQARLDHAANSDQAEATRATTPRRRAQPAPPHGLEFQPG